MNKRETVWRLLTCLSLVILLITSAGCAAPTATPEEVVAEESTTPPIEVPEVSEEEADVVKVAYVPIMHFAAAYVAEGRGYFDALGLDVEFTTVSSGTEAVAFLSEGQVDVGAIAVVASTWNAFSEGLDLRVVAPSALKRLKDDPTMLIVRKDLWDNGEVKTAADLRGRTIGAAGGPGSGAEYSISKALEPSGLTIFDVELVRTSNPDLPAAIESGAVDAVYAGSPYATTIIDAGTGVPLVKDFTPGAMVAVFVYSGKFMEERPEVAQRFMRGLMQGARAMQGDEYLSEDNIAAYLQFVNSTEETIRNTPEMLYDPNLAVKMNSVMDVQETHMKNGRLEYDSLLPLDNVVDLTWQQSAIESLGRWEAPVLDPPEQVKVAYVATISFAPLYVAAGRGLFEAEGLDVEFERVRSGTEAIAFLTEGQVDVGGIAVVASAWNAFAQGMDLRIVGPGARRPETGDATMIMVRKDLYDSGEVTSLADLEGRVVAAAGGPGSGAEYLLAKGFERVGLTIFDVELVNISNPDLPAAFESGAVDAALVGMPYSVTIQDAGTGVPLAQDLTPGAQGPVFVFSGKFMKERPEAARRFALALMKAARLMQGDNYYDDENIAAYLSFVSSTEETLKSLPANIYDPNMEFNLESMMESQRIYMENGRLEYEDLIPIEEVVDESWRLWALMILGGYQE